MQGKTFLWQNEKYEFNQFICAQPPRFVAERTGVKCAPDGAEMYRIGYNVTKGRFLATMQVCYNDDYVRTYYTQHELQPANIHYQRRVDRMNFSKAGHFLALNINYLYTQKNQQQQAAALLQGNHAQFFDDKTLFLARGHLAAKADFIYANQQRSSFTFFNAAPQWQSFNGGQWNALEDEVRKFVAKSQLQVDCYTGTWGTLELPLYSGEQRQFYLSYDANNNGLLPVPKLFYRVIIERQQQKQPKRGIVLIGVNNPHASMQQLEESYIICNDIREQVPWLRWMSNKNLKKGFLYACKVSDFIRVVQHLPAELASVKELLVAA